MVKSFEVQGLLQLLMVFVVSVRFFFFSFFFFLFFSRRFMLLSKWATAKSDRSKCDVYFGFKVQGLG